MSGGWGCPHEDQGCCRRRASQPCEPGAESCVLEEAYRRGRAAPVDEAGDEETDEEETS